MTPFATVRERHPACNGQRKNQERYINGQTSKRGMSKGSGLIDGEVVSLLAVFSCKCQDYHEPTKRAGCSIH